MKIRKKENAYKKAFKDFYGLRENWVKKGVWSASMRAVFSLKKMTKKYPFISFFHSSQHACFWKEQKAHKKASFSFPFSHSCPNIKWIEKKTASKEESGSGFFNVIFFITKFLRLLYIRLFNCCEINPEKLRGMLKIYTQKYASYFHVSILPLVNICHFDVYKIDLALLQCIH